MGVMSECVLINNNILSKNQSSWRGGRVLFLRYYEWDNLGEEMFLPIALTGAIQNHHDICWSLLMSDNMQRKDVSGNGRGLDPISTNITSIG